MEKHITKKTAKKTTSKKAPDAKNAKKNTLIIVESPSKAHTIEKYLGPGYKVKASMGHLIDLPKSRLGVDLEHNFAPDYITVRGRAKILKDLQKDAMQAKAVLLASDNDREGEAIAWHLRHAIEPKITTDIKRIVFNEITPVAIKEAVKHPGEIQESKVNAQKARRVLDRLVGYNLSPLLWKKVKNGLSAGRVQSVALRLICEREKEVDNFIPEEYWSLDADFQKGKIPFSCQLVSYKGQKPDLKNKAQVQSIIDTIKNTPCIVSEQKQQEKSIKPKAPFTTSKMQQTAANRLGFTSRKTMQVAQQLYEGVNVGTSRVGLITYMRTDSVRTAQSALDEVRDFIGKNYPPQCLPQKQIIYSVGKAAQDAHEAIRPTYVSYTPESIRQYLTPEQHKLYSIIWEQFVSSQMTNALSLTTSTDIKAKDAVFRVSSTQIKEKGFYAALKTLLSKSEKSRTAPPLVVGEEVKVLKFYPEQHFTLGPARYTDASIVKALEEKGIGRPSTYAPIISVLLDRYYVSRNNKQLVPTILGKKICEILVQYFPEVINENFTKDVEDKLDLVEQDKLVWETFLADFFWPFKQKVDTLQQSIQSIKGTLDEPTDIVCDKCGKPMVKKLGRFGYFLACTGFPECKNAKSIPLAKCPMPGCGGDIVAHKTKGRGGQFYSCTNYPKCTFLTHFKPIDTTCPKCGWFMVEKSDKKTGTHKVCINPDCDYLHSDTQEQ